LVGQIPKDSSDYDPGAFEEPEVIRAHSSLGDSDLANAARPAKSIDFPLAVFRVTVPQLPLHNDHLPIVQAGSSQQILDLDPLSALFRHLG
jgi:hypothetical protein